MNTQVAVCENQHPFYQNRIAWLPIFLKKPGDEHNSTRVCARWLCFLITDAMSINLDFDLGIDFTQAHLRIGLPYVNFFVRIPWPHKVDMWAHRNLWRVGARSKYKWQR